MDLNKELGTDLGKLSKDVVAKGGVLANFYFDLHAKNKDSLQQLGAALVQKILQEQDVVYAVGEIDEPMENGDMFSTTVDVTVLVKKLFPLSRICGNYSPFSIEIVEPKEIRIPISEAHELLMNVATTNYELKKFIMEKVYKEKELAELNKVVLGRMELGRKLMEKKR